MRLVIHDGDSFDREVELADSDLRIGRAEQNDIVLPDPSQTVSRVHAKLQYEGDGYVLTDLNSANGVWVGDRRVSTISLQPGELVTLGPYTLRLQSERGTSLKSKTPKGWGGATKSSPSFIGYLSHVPRPILFGGFAVCMIGVMVLGQISVPAKPGPRTVRTRTEPVKPLAQPRNALFIQQHLAEARILLDRHKFDDGIKQLDQVLFVEPLNAEALELRMKANEMKAAAPPHSAIALARPDAETVSSGADTPETTSSEPTEVSQSKRTSTLVVDKIDRANRGSRVQPQVARRPGEDLTAWYGRDREMEQRYDRAKSELDRGAFQNAVANFGEIERNQQGYKDVSMLLTQARDGQQALEKSVLEKAMELEVAGDFPGALRRYVELQQLNPYSAPLIEEATQRVGARLTSDAADALSRAKQYDAYGRIPEAVELYERAYQYLPDSDPNKQNAKSRLEVLRAR